MELWDVYDENRVKRGYTYVRESKRLLAEGEYHLVVHVWIRNARGQFLMSRRAASRPHNPLLWECVGGSVIAGEDSLAGALRECYEEIGVRLVPEAGEVIFTHVRGIIDGRIFNDIMDVWLFGYEGEADLCAATTEEVSETRWMTLAEIRALWDRGEMVPSLFYFFDREELGGK